MVVPAAVLLLATTGCGVVNGLGASSEEPEEEQLAAVVDALTDSPGLRGSFRTSLTGSTLDGDVDLVTGAAMDVDYRFESTLNVDNPDSTEGRLLVAAGQAFLQSPDFEPPDGREWFSVARDPASSFDDGRTAQWLVLALSRLLDPMFLLTQGIPQLTATEETVGGVAATKYAGQWQFGLDEPGPELAHWANTVMHASYLDVSLWVDSSSQPVQLTVGSSGVVLFTLEVSYTDHGADLTIEAPDADLVVAQ